MCRVRSNISHPSTNPPTQVGTTKGTGGDVLILEEAAYVDPGARALSVPSDSFLPY